MACWQVGVYIERNRERVGAECPEGFIDQDVEDASIVRCYVEANGQFER